MKATQSWRKAAVGAVLTALALVLPAQTPAQEATAYHWQAVPFGAGGYVDGFLYHPKQKDVLYARTDIGGMYRYDYAAKRWLPLMDHLGKADGDLMGVLAIAIDPNNPQKLYAACGEYLGEWARKAALLRSDDQGKTWQKTELNFRLGGNWDGRGSGERLVVDPKDSDTLYLGTSQDGLWKSANGGKYFYKESGAARAVSFVAIDPKTRDVYIGSGDDKGRLLVSHDGSSFAPVEGTPDMVPQRMAFAADGSLYVTFAKGDGQGAVNPSHAVGGAVYKRDAAGTWHEVSPVPGTNFGYSGVDVGPSGAVVVTTLDRWAAGDDAFVSMDGGAHWIALGASSRHDASAYPWLVSYMKGEDRMGHWMSDVKINPFNADEMIYGTGYGLWMSRNLTAAGSPAKVNFDFAVRDFEETATIQMVSPTVGAKVLVAMGDVGGAGWHDITKTPDAGLFLPVNETNASVDYAGARPALVVRVTHNDPTHGLYSLDGGISWKVLPSSPYKPVKPGENWRGPGVIAVSAKGGSMVWGPEKDGAYYSKDMGQSWQPVAGWPAGRDLILTPVADKAVESVFYLFDRYTSSIMISVDGGASFKTVVGGLPKIEGWQNAQLAVVPGRMRDLWLAAPYGLIHSKDSVTPVTNMKQVTEAWYVSFGAPAHAGDYPAVYLWGKVKGKEGLWRSDDEGASWVRINDDAHQFGGFRAIAGDMREYGTLYIAPHGRGILVGRP